MCTKLTVAQHKRWKTIWDHYKADPLRQDIPFFIERWVCVSQAVEDGQHYLSTFATFEDLCAHAGISVLEDGRVPVAAYDIDTCEHVDLHVSTPVVSRSEEQGQTIDALRGEQ